MSRNIAEMGIASFDTVSQEWLIISRPGAAKNRAGRTKMRSRVARGRSPARAA